ncbi:type II toxin-antitoxin system RelE/ParE family toxin [Candidatus Saccharibacteria bacterium]|nr:type II toxin-antitoxin system RelE/ParE family toxin [Candidatus Saccharibacteria bacterium]
MPSIYKVSLTPEALEDFEEIILNLRGITWLSSVRKWANKIINKIESLAVFPEGHPMYEYDERFRSAKVGKYRIIFEISKDEKIVSVLRIVYARRNLKEIGDLKIDYK